MEKSVERLFPFAMRARILLIGGDVLRRSRSVLHFVLITNDLSEKSREQVLRDFAPYPIVQQYTSADLKQFFDVQGAKVIGFKKSSLAQSIYREMKSFRINGPGAGGPPVSTGEKQ